MAKQPREPSVYDLPKPACARVIMGTDEMRHSNPDEIGRISQIAVMQCKANISFVRVLIAALVIVQYVHDVAFL
jgi:hypothetical protein